MASQAKNTISQDKMEVFEGQRFPPQTVYDYSRETSREREWETERKRQRSLRIDPILYSVSHDNSDEGQKLICRRHTGSHYF